MDKTATKYATCNYLTSIEVNFIIIQKLPLLFQHQVSKHSKNLYLVFLLLFASFSDSEGTSEVKQYAAQNSLAFVKTSATDHTNYEKPITILIIT